MSRSRILPTILAALLITMPLLADDAPKNPTDPKAARKAKLAAKQKAAAEAAAKAKADDDAAKAKAKAKAKAEAEAKARAEAEAAAKAKRDAETKPETKPTPPPITAKPMHTDTASLTQRIDAEISKKLAAEKIPASPRADDAEFFRRIYLDLTGVIPSAEKAAAFIDDQDPKKREKIIDQLLSSPAYGKHMADLWDNLLFQRVTDNRAIQTQPLNEWLESRFNANKGWHEMVTEILTATGTQEDNGASTFFLGQQSADKMVDAVSRLFLGVKMECAQCHNHPFTGWKQNDYWGMAAFFMNVRIAGNTKNNKGATAPGVSENGKGRQRNLPESAKMLPPKFFQADQPKVKTGDPLRPVLAKWMTSPDNKFFARAMANRIWGQLFGAGIINPIDDMHEERIPSHPELLAELGKQLSSHEFDLKYMYRAICNSESYQRTSRPVAGNEKDTVLFSHMNIKAFTPEQLFDSLIAVMGMPGQGEGRPKGAQAQKRGPVTPRDQFVAFFDPGEGAKATEYEAGIPQALRLMNSPQTARAIPKVATTLTKGLSTDKAIEKLYLAALARRPTTAEMTKMTEYVTKNSSDGYGDLLWALLNSSEFTLNH